MRPSFPALIGVLVLVTSSSAQTIVPGDRPAGNIRGTRSAPLARHGMIATSQSLASVAGLRVLQEGGNAIDAAITAAAVLSVVEPSMNGIGGDLFALVYDAKSRKVYGLDSSGRSSHLATPAEFARRALTRMPEDGPLPVDVPGVIEGWSQLLSRFGTRPLSQVLQPAIGYAREGFGVHEIVAGDWAASAKKLSGDPAAANTFLPGGRAPRAGELFQNENLAKSLELIAKEGRDAFYKGAIAKAIAGDMKSRDGLLDLEDLAAHQAEWLEPISTNYRGYDVFEMPPSTQGFVALEMLNLMEGFDVKAMGHNSADYLHLVAEAKKIAFADRSAYLADRDFMPKGALRTLISKDYATKRRPEIDMAKAHASYAAGLSDGDTSAPVDFAGRDLGDTIYMTVADGQGNVVSLIQSLFDSFGAGIVAGDTGITLHNRGAGFVLTPGHPNQIGPGKRPLHTLVPAMILKDGRPWVSFGVMGGDNQGQAHAQVVANLVDFGMNVRDAGDAARMRHMGANLAVESGIEAEVRKALELRGHRITDARGFVGGYQAVLIDSKTGLLMGGSDLRKDGLAIGW
ncbi:MAG: gamma-glutamyltransferase [Vicinamibacteria bacterium]|nr:gamma-glutamyltransferase [Vicinamibacteria bacterium]